MAYLQRGIVTSQMHMEYFPSPSCGCSQPLNLTCRPSRVDNYHATERIIAGHALHCIDDPVRS